MYDDHQALRDAFPYPPYDIQQQFMINVVETLENCQIGLFESPTGTGKTLSVICSTLYWLEKERERQQQAAAEALAAQGAADGLPDWLTGTAAATAAPPASATPMQAKASKPVRKAKAPLLDDEGNDLSDFLPDSAAHQDDTPSPAGAKRTAPDAGSYSSSEDEAEPPAAADAQSDAAAAVVERRRPQVIFCSRTHSQLSQFVGELHRTRFASSLLLVAVASRKALCVNDQVRQLSELSQLNERCLELQRNKASSSSKRRGAAADSAGTAAFTSSVVGFSGAPRPRQQQQRQRSSCKTVGCPFLSVEGGAAAWSDFKDLVLETPMDVEELASLGRKMKICPYYGSRRAVPGADVVLAPYSAVLMPDARESLGIELHDSVLVFDEAHNLLDAINSAHSTTVTAWQLLSVQRSLTAYYDRFKAVLNPINAQNIQRLLHVAAALHSCLQLPQAALPDGQQQQQQQQQQQPGTGSAHTTAAGAATDGSSNSSSRCSSRSWLVTVNDLLFDLGLDNINMFELAHWVRDNKMAFKVSGYTAAAVAKAGGSIQLQRGGQAADSSRHDQHASADQQQTSLGHLSAKDGVSAIHAFISFLLSLTHADADGRVIVEAAATTTTTTTTSSLQAAATAAGAAHTPSTAGGASASSGSRADAAARGGQLRYVLLNAARHFGSLLASARSVLLVSGTLAPVEGLAAQLFPDAGPARVRHFECGHVVPPQQLLTVSIGRGPSGRALQLKHEARGDAGMLTELGQVLFNLAGVVPEGLVVFVPSFSYLEQLTQHWRTAGVWDRLAQRTQVFSEPRAATDVEAVLAAYTAAISGTTDSTSDGTQAEALGGGTAGAQPSPGSSRSRGAVMLCVVGGKLSEGINFGDGLGRCVVVVGLPYPNRADVELQARMVYLDRLAVAAAAASRPTDVATACQAAADTAVAQQHNAADAADGQQRQQQQTHLAVAPARRSAFQVLNQGASRLLQAAAPEPVAGPAQPSPATAAAPPLSAPAAVSPPIPQQQQSAGPAAAAGAPFAGQQAAAGQPVAPTATDSSSSSSSRRLLTGRDYYEDLCFKAVNQCVGRVVRHRGDYAAVVLLDTRWVAGPAEWAAISNSSSRSVRKVPVQKLPGWLQRSYVPTGGDFGPALKQLAAFYKRQVGGKVEEVT